MSRSGYSDDCDFYDRDDYLRFGRYRAQVASATRGKRGQQFFRSIVEALDAMPEKRLIPSPKIDHADFGQVDSIGDRDGNVCVLGALAKHRGLPVLEIDPEDHDKLGDTFNIAHQLASEAMYMNDDYFDDNYSPETRWLKMREWAVSKLAKDDNGH